MGCIGVGCHGPCHTRVTAFVALDKADAVLTVQRDEHQCDKMIAIVCDEDDHTRVYYHTHDDVNIVPNLATVQNCSHVRVSVLVLAHLS